MRAVHRSPRWLSVSYALISSTVEKLDASNERQRFLSEEPIIIPTHLSFITCSRIVSDGWSHLSRELTRAAYSLITVPRRNLMTSISRALITPFKNRAAISIETASILAVEIHAPHERRSTDLPPPRERTRTAIMETNDPERISIRVIRSAIRSFTLDCFASREINRAIDTDSLRLCLTAAKEDRCLSRLMLLIVQCKTVIDCTERVMERTLAAWLVRSFVSKSSVIYSSTLLRPRILTGLQRTEEFQCDGVPFRRWFYYTLNYWACIARTCCNSTNGE